ncbi:MAG: DUF4062 domain-containing protein [Bryobacteraceae bacterium]
MEKRYQVFVSSTFLDLVDERRAVMQALLELNCIPAGMELFPASSDDQWTLIQRVIDDCDYYVVILGGRYGSVDAAGIGYTEKEYDYALETKKPVMAFLHKDPGTLPAKNTDRDAALGKKLDAFREKAQRRMCRYWSNADELGGVVSRSFVQLIRTHPAEGWVKARHVKTADELEKINVMHERIRVLERENEALRSSIAESAPTLARGDERVQLWIVMRDQDIGSEELYDDPYFVQPFAVETSWNEIWNGIAPMCIDCSLELSIREALSDVLEPDWDGYGILDDQSTQKIKVQFFALGLLDVERVSGDLFWKLTEAGRRAVGGSIALGRTDDSSEVSDGRPAPRSPAPATPGSP